MVKEKLYGDQYFEVWRDYGAKPPAFGLLDKSDMSGVFVRPSTKSDVDRYGHGRYGFRTTGKGLKVVGYSGPRREANVMLMSHRDAYELFDSVQSGLLKKLKKKGLDKHGYYVSFIKSHDMMKDGLEDLQRFVLR